jgi:hypothetical protein
MSAKEALLRELNQQPDAVARKLLDYLHSLVPASQSGGAQGHFGSYWTRYYGAFDSEAWEEPAEQPLEKREDW